MASLAAQISVMELTRYTAAYFDYVQFLTQLWRLVIADTLIPNPSYQHLLSSISPIHLHHCQQLRKAASFMDTRTHTMAASCYCGQSDITSLISALAFVYLTHTPTPLSTAEEGSLLHGHTDTHHGGVLLLRTV
eukprot:TRINITY_DN25157_c0_g1_i4.p1 TRINITY_DN25157_c0_g1~~TRINITY_DN25157_c0_g1_i4.p1  ORF type:complete len:134 (-),score=12.84 TRINITY_DN25157_c0_g1_i4:10-411(-)